MIRATVRPELPSGTVTFLFTDVEGSTTLLEEIGDEAYEGALSVHRRIVRAACQAHDGVEVDTQGDAFFFAFPEPSGALASAQQMTEGLGAGPIRVRVGLHTGTPRVSDEGYVGKEVHFAARVAATGHGGQIVLSQATARLVDGELTDLGEHRLKDIAEPVSIFQFGDSTFPPLKTISNTNLPRPASSFVGRESEVAEVLAKIEAGARLLTLTGPGGSGKTRLALEAASTVVPEYKAGVFWINLSALRDPALVTDTISQTLGAKDGLVDHISEREMLLLLDNLEQVIDSAPDLSRLLAACPNLTLLVTSRELLRVQGEVEYPVPPLASPEAVALFSQRSSIEPSEEIAELCARLDNLPLAVELAAARTRALTPGQILERLSERLDLLKGGRDADPRQQTLRATIEWSHGLLSEEEQRLFGALSVFAGGCTLEAAAEVADAGLDTLQSLIEKSLLRFTNERYWMLETIREYAGERLEAGGGTSELQLRHALLYLSLAEDARREMQDQSRQHVLAKLEHELANLRASLSWLRSAGSSVDELRLLRALAKFWLARDHMAEGESVLTEALARIPDDRSELRMRVELALGEIAMRRGRPEIARPSVERWLLWAREEGGPSDIAWALSSPASIHMNEGDFGGSVSLLDEALDAARAVADTRLLSNVAGNLGYALSAVGDYERAAQLCRESIELAPTASDVCVDHANLGLALLGLGDLDGAGSEYRIFDRRRFGIRLLLHARRRNGGRCCGPVQAGRIRRSSCCSRGS